MVVAAFPVFKLGAIFIKQISKPLATAVKTRAKQSPFFRNYICMPPAQFYHWAEVRIKMWSMNLGKPVNIPKLNEAMAIELGAELVGEGLIFTIAAGALVSEYVRSSRKEAAREEERKLEMAQIQSDLKDLYFANAKLETQVREIVRILHINIPQSSFNPDVPNFESIPAHHRVDQPAEESGGIVNGLKGLVWNAIELILPTVGDKENPDLQNVTPKTNNNSSPTTGTLPSSSGNVSKESANQQTTNNNATPSPGRSSLPTNTPVAPNR